MRRYARWVVGVASLYLLATIALLAFGALSLHSAERHLERARSEFSLAAAQRRHHPNIDTTARGFRRAHAAFHSPLLLPVKLVPVFGRQLSAVDSLAGASHTALEVGLDALDAGARIASRKPADGSARIKAVKDAGQIARASTQRLTHLRLGPSSHLLAPVARRRAVFVAEINRIGDVLTRADVGTGAMEKFLTGPSHYVVFGANNSEMRAGSGMYLSAGVLTVEDGEFTLGPMKSIEYLPPAPHTVPLEEDFKRLWGPQGPGSDYRTANMTPNFPTSGALLKRMWAASGEDPVDGVFAVDPIMTVNLLKAVGPQRVGTVDFTADNAAALLLHDQYAAFSNDSLAVRREFLGDVTASLFAAINRGAVSASRLGTELAASARGRHLLAWTDDAAIERGWVALGMDGQLPDQSLMFALQNRGANKLDYFQQVTATTRVAENRAGSDFTVEFRVTNTVPDGEPSYVAGPKPGLYTQEPNLYVGIVSVNLPKAATNVRLTGGAFNLVAGADGNTLVISQWVEIKQATTVRFVLRFRLPPGYNALNILPSARIPAVQWIAGRRTWTDTEARTITW